MLFRGHLDPAATRVRDRSSSWALAGLSLAMLMPSLDTSIANAGLPVLARAFDASFQQAQWIVLAYLLAVTSLIVSAGWLGDVVGRRVLILTAIAVFTVSSAACGAAPVLWMMLLARVIQGLAAAAMMAQAIALVSDAVPSARTGAAMGLLGSMSAVGTALGPSLGGIVISTLGWPWLFFVNVPAGITAYLLVHRYLPPDRVRAVQVTRRFDLAGTTLLTTTLVAYALAATASSAPGVSSVAMLALAVISGAAFYFVEQRVIDPLIDIRALRDGGLRGGLIVSGLVSAVMMTTLVVGPFYLARVVGLPLIEAGLALSTGPVVSALAGAPSGRLVDRIGAHRMAVVGLAGIAAGAVGLVASVSSGLAGYLSSIAVMTASYATFQSANNTVIMTAADSSRRGVIAGLLSLSRNLGLISGAAAMGAVFAYGVGTSNLMTAAPDAIARGMRVTFGVAAAAMLVALLIAMRRLSAHSSVSPKEMPC